MWKKWINFGTRYYVLKICIVCLKTQILCYTYFPSFSSKCTPCLLHYSYKLLGRYSSIATASREASRISPNRIWPKMLEMHIAHKPNVHMFDENPFFKVSKVKLCTARFLPWFFYARKSWKIVFIFVRYSSFIKIKVAVFT